MKKILYITLIFCSIIEAQTKTDKIGSMPGAFSRMGFGARGMGMGNAMSAVNQGNLVAYYNPALSVFQSKSSFQANYSVLSLDRSLNFLNFTRKFEFGLKDTTAGKPKSTAGFSAGIINAGVSEIDGRDNQGIKTGALKTSENQFFISVANQFSKKLAIGISIKFYYYKLYENITSNGLGFDLGLLYTVNENLNISFMLADLNSKYKWDTSPIRDEEGNATENKFPTIKKIGASYRLNNPNLIVAAEFESSNAGTNYIRLGAEYNIFDKLYIRSGLDRWNLKNSETPVKPSFGFSFFKDLNNMILGIDYAFVIEPYSSSDHHIIGLNFSF